jgi:hypothetical protein
MPDEQAFLGRLEKLSPSTLKVLVETGPWITEEVGGEEVDIASLYRT